MSYNTGGPAFPHGPLGDSIQYEDGRIAHQWQGSPGMDLIDWFAGQETLADYDHPDAVYGDKLAASFAGPKPAGGWAEDPRGMFDWEAKVRAGMKYARASAMLAEKARREAVVQESSTSADAGDTLRRLAADVLPADIRDAAGDEPLGWCAEQVRARVNTLTERNREFVEALSWVSKMIATTADHKSKVALTVILREVDALLAKHKDAK